MRDFSFFKAKPENREARKTEDIQKIWMSRSIRASRLSGILNSPLAIPRYLKFKLRQFM